MQQRGRLLIADDNSVSRDVLRQWLVRQGYDVDEAFRARMIQEEARLRQVLQEQINSYLK